MLFSSSIFLHLFLPILLVAYFVSPRMLRNGLLLFASLVFYSWGEPNLILLMLGSAGLNFLVGRWIGNTLGTSTCRWVLTLGIVGNLLFLGYFKYAVLIVESLSSLSVALNGSGLQVPDIVLPIGISFYTFQAMAYLIDVYREEVPADQNIVNVALYIALFPQLIAGPIVRYTQIADDLYSRRETLDGFADGVQRFVFGLGKKLLIANSLAAVADPIFDLPNSQLTMTVAWLGMVCYTLQIYFDFSGYSDMAIGLGRMFGFSFPENFRYPYIAQSVTEFWRRWHLSLSTWFRDYLYIPLGGNRCAAWRNSLNLLIVFLLCGLWHGASWTFVVWGVYHGVFLMVERQGLGETLSKLWRPLRHAYLLLAVIGGWVLFRADSFGHATAIYRAMLGLQGWNGLEYPWQLYLDSGVALALLAGCIGSLPILPWLREKLTAPAQDAPASLQVPRMAFTGVLAVGQLVLLAAVLVASSAVLAAGTHNPFIYFRF